MYKEIPVQSRLIEKKFNDLENLRRQRKIQAIMAQPVNKSMSFCTVPQQPRGTKKFISYNQELEIKIVNRKLCDNMKKIMLSDYKSAVKTAISNRKSIFIP